ncbi:hypothetical protein EMMF5_004789 [Cystobasidiomycetes sp. EMM_F5]
MLPRGRFLTIASFFKAISGELATVAACLSFNISYIQSVTMTRNLSLVFKKVPKGEPVIGETFAIEDRPIDLDQELEKGSLLVKNKYISADPYMRGRLRDPSVKSYAPAYQLNEPMDSRGVAEVIKSANDNFKKGQLISVPGKIAEYVVVPEANAKTARIINPSSKVDLGHQIGALGMPGLTAYSSLYEIGHPKKGEVIWVSAASGAVGQIVCQLAKHEGLTVIASVGDDRKVEFMKNELGIEHTFNYKKQDTNEALKKFAPEGIDIFYDNVGGEQLEIAIDHLNNEGRIIACGAISQYNLSPEKRYGVKNMFNFVSKRLLMKGFIVGDKDFAPKYYADHQKNVGKWLEEGSFKAKLHVEEGIERAGEAIMTLFSKDESNFGKVVIKVN